MWSIIRHSGSGLLRSEIRGKYLRFQRDRRLRWSEGAKCSLILSSAQMLCTRVASWPSAFSRTRIIREVVSGNNGGIQVTRVRAHIRSSLVCFNGAVNETISASPGRRTGTSGLYSCRQSGLCRKVRRLYTRRVHYGARSLRPRAFVLSVQD